MKTIKLQGISAPQPAIEARELKPGMTRLYNYGETGEIVSVTPSKTGKSVTVTVLENGKEYTRRMNAGALVAVIQDGAKVAAPKKSEEIKAKIDAINSEYDETIQRMVYQNPDRKTAEDHDRLWAEFWRKAAKQADPDNAKRIQASINQLQKAVQRAGKKNRELNRELEVGDGVTMHLWSDAHACTIISRTDKTLTIQRDKAIRDPSFKPQWVPGGFSAICTNSEEQSWTYERDPAGEIIRCRWYEKNGCWQSGSDGSIRISRGRHEHYDYNF